MSAAWFIASLLACVLVLEFLVPLLYQIYSENMPLPPLDNPGILICHFLVFDGKRCQLSVIKSMIAHLLFN